MFLFNGNIFVDEFWPKDADLYAALTLTLFVAPKTLTVFVYLATLISSFILVYWWARNFTQNKFKKAIMAGLTAIDIAFILSFLLALWKNLGYIN